MKPSFHLAGASSSAALAKFQLNDSAKKCKSPSYEAMNTNGPARMFSPSSGEQNGEPTITATLQINQVKPPNLQSLKSIKEKQMQSQTKNRGQSVAALPARHDFEITNSQSGPSREQTNLLMSTMDNQQTSKNAAQTLQSLHTLQTIGNRVEGQSVSGNESALSVHNKKGAFAPSLHQANQVKQAGNIGSENEKKNLVLQGRSGSLGRPGRKHTVHMQLKNHDQTDLESLATIGQSNLQINKISKNQSRVNPTDSLFVVKNKQGTSNSKQDCSFTDSTTLPKIDSLPPLLERNSTNVSTVDKQSSFTQKSHSVCMPVDNQTDFFLDRMLKENSTINNGGHPNSINQSRIQKAQGLDNQIQDNNTPSGHTPSEMSSRYSDYSKLLNLKQPNSLQGQLLHQGQNSRDLKLSQLKPPSSQCLEVNSANITQHSGNSGIFGSKAKSIAPLENISVMDPTNKLVTPKPVRSIVGQAGEMQMLNSNKTQGNRQNKFLAADNAHLPYKNTHSALGQNQLSPPQHYSHHLHTDMPNSPANNNRLIHNTEPKDRYQNLLTPTPLVVDPTTTNNNSVLTAPQTVSHSNSILPSLQEKCMQKEAELAWKMAQNPNAIGGPPMNLSNKPLVKKQVQQNLKFQQMQTNQQLQNQSMSLNGSKIEQQNQNQQFSLNMIPPNVQLKRLPPQLQIGSDQFDPNLNVNVLANNLSSHAALQQMMLSPNAQQISPRQHLSNPNQIFQNSKDAAYSYHFIYDYLIVQVSSKVYEREYAHRIKLYPQQPKHSISSAGLYPEGSSYLDHQYNEHGMIMPIEDPDSPFNNQITDLEKQRTYETQFELLRVLMEPDLSPDLEMQQLLNLASCQLQEHNKKFKITVKKNYINDILSYAKGAVNVAQKVFLVVSDSQAVPYTESNKKPRMTNSTIPKQVPRNQQEDVKSPRESDEIRINTPNVFRNKGVKNVGKGLNGTRGYDSENENCRDSTTTSNSNMLNCALNQKIMTPVKNRSSTRNLASLPPKSTKQSKKLDNLLTFHSDNSNEQKVMNQKYGPTKIKILHPYEKPQSLRQHAIQKMFDHYNEFVKIVFSQRSDYSNKYELVMPRLLKLAKRLGLSLVKGQLKPENIKVRENANALKEKLFFCWIRIINEENKFDAEVPEIFAGKILHEQTKADVEHDQKIVDSYQTPEQKQILHYYKCFVGKGNNAMLVRSMFKSRYWWLIHDKEEPEKVNFLWTQCRKNSILFSLRSKLIKINDPQLLSPRKNKKKKDKIKDTDDKTLDVIPQEPPSTKLEQFPLKVYNKLEDNWHLSNKKALFINMKNYYEALGQQPFDALPVTFHVKSGLDDPEFIKFQNYYRAHSKDKHNIWIIKPGECTNQGQGISVSKDWTEIQELIESSTHSKKRTCIVQKYIHNPLLINRRKFDIRTYALMTCQNSCMKGYFYHEGYMRTSTREFSLNNLSNKVVHLTNDAIQKKADDYGKFEAGNKISYTDFQHYIDMKHTDLSIDFERDILMQIKKLTADCMRAVWGKMDPNKRIGTFEIFGLDFMIADDFKVFLIEVNTNPCLELSSPLLARLIPCMLENAMRIVADPLFPPPEGYSQKKQVVNDVCPENKFDLIFDEKIDGPELNSLWKEKANVIVELNEDELSDQDDIHDDED